MSRIPIGYMTTYNAIAETVGGSPRAVGQVMAANPFPLLIPCHKVFRADFSISGYGLGEKVKLELLQREDRGYEETAELRVNEKTLALFPVKRLQRG